ncbi:MAG: VPLPA-CTERM sorting domain-containing protein [Pseudomonadota bacterium]
MKTLIATLFAGALFVTPATASTVIDFDALDASATQPVPLLTFSEDGFTFSLSSTGANSGPAIFDTTVSDADANGDTELTPPFLPGSNGFIEGNIIILQDNTGAVPDDDASGGTITLTLESGPAFFLENVSAIDDGFFEVFTITGGGPAALFGSVDLDEVGGLPETGLITGTSTLISVGDSIVFDFNSFSGGFDSVTVTAVPLPAPVAMLLAAIGGLFVMARRRRA